nr:hypothetical protein [Tanacetum cinerariifolium]
LWESVATGGKTLVVQMSTSTGNTDFLNSLNLGWSKAVMGTRTKGIFIPFPGLMKRFIEFLLEIRNFITKGACLLLGSNGKSDGKSWEWWKVAGVEGSGVNGADGKTGY